MGWEGMGRSDGRQRGGKIEHMKHVWERKGRLSGLKKESKRSEGAGTDKWGGGAVRERERSDKKTETHGEAERWKIRKEEEGGRGKK